MADPSPTYEPLSSALSLVTFDGLFGAGTDDESRRHRLVGPNRRAGGVDRDQAEVIGRLGAEPGEFRGDVGFAAEGRPWFAGNRPGFVGFGGAVFEVAAGDFPPPAVGYMAGERGCGLADGEAWPVVA